MKSPILAKEIDKTSLIEYNNCKIMLGDIINMNKIKATPITNEAFAPFGQFY